MRAQLTPHILEINMPTPLPRSLPAVGWTFSLDNFVTRLTSFVGIVFEAFGEAQRMRIEARRRFPAMEE